MTKKDSKPEYTKLTDILKAYDGDLSQVTSKALSNAIKKAIQEKHIAITTMIPLTAPETKFVLDDKHKVQLGMPLDKDGKASKGFQAYGNDYVILNTDAFEEWFTSYMASLNSKSKSAKNGVTAEDIMNMSEEEREAHMKAFLGAGAGSAGKLTNPMWTKLKKEVRGLMDEGKFDEAGLAIGRYNPRGEQYKSAKRGLEDELNERREAQSEESEE